MDDSGLHSVSRLFHGQTAVLIDENGEEVSFKLSIESRIPHSVLAESLFPSLYFGNRFAVISFYLCLALHADELTSERI